MKQYIGISRDHSGSMVNIAKLAMKDYNEQIAELKANAIRFGIDTTASVMSCSIRQFGGRTENIMSEKLVSVVKLPKMTHYETSGNNTQLWDSVNELIAHFQNQRDIHHPDTSVLLMILTDGQDNNSRISANVIANKIKDLQATDRWTITFRVPAGMKTAMVRQGIPAGNILEVDYSSEESIETATALTKAATTQYYTQRSSGIRGSATFYADVQATTQEVRRELSNISKKVKIVRVTKADDGKKIQDFIIEKTGQYHLGTVFYQLTKREEVQPSKKFIVWDKNSGEYYTGAEARTLLNIPPAVGTIKLVPGQNDQFEVFVQSNSVNRKLVGSTKVVIYEPY